MQMILLDFLLAMIFSNLFVPNLFSFFCVFVSYICVIFRAFVRIRKRSKFRNRRRHIYI